jgi:hypothetical protein
MTSSPGLLAAGEAGVLKDEALILLSDPLYKAAGPVPVIRHESQLLWRKCWRFGREDT